MVVPDEIPQTPDDCCGLWTTLEIKARRVGLFEQLTGLSSDGVFVAGAGEHGAECAGPDAGIGGLQPVSAGSPAVAVTDHGDFACIGSPYRESHSSRNQMGAPVPVECGGVHGLVEGHNSAGN